MADLNGRPLTIGSFGLVLVVATAAAQIRRRAVGTAVFGGTIAAISRLRERPKVRLGCQPGVSDAPPYHA
jgi:hypothetical protein